jgi:RNA polymerase sigma factor (TIGR02999 family)
VEAAAELLPEVYSYLRNVAQKYCRGGRAPTVGATGLVHEAYLRLAGTDGGSRWRDREHFCAVAATAMRQVLVDACRRRLAAKRGGGVAPVTLPDEGTPGEAATVDLLDLDALLTRLAALDARLARVVELRTFGGLTGEEIAEVLGISRRTVETDWRKAKAWLAAELGGWRFE